MGLILLLEQEIVVSSEEAELVLCYSYAAPCIISETLAVCTAETASVAHSYLVHILHVESQHKT